MAAQGVELPFSSGSFAPIRKRPRPVHSCVDCRLKKLKCNRETPCDTCLRAGRSSTCSYDALIGSLSQNPPINNRSNASPDVKRARRQSSIAALTSYHSPNEVFSPAGYHHTFPHAPTREGSVASPATRVDITNAAQNTPSYVDASLRIETLEARIRKLEEAGTPRPEADITHPVLTASFSMQSRSVTVKDDTRSRFLGPSDARTLFKDFPMVSPFVERKIREPDTLKLINSLLDFFPKKPRRIYNDVPVDRQACLSKIQELLPPQRICDRMVTTYLDEFEQTFRILHRGTFIQNYQAYWQARPCPASTFPMFIPQLALVLVLSFSAKAPSSNLDDASWDMDKSIACCELVSSWLSGRRGKESIEFSNLCNETLLVMARKLTETSIGDHWIATGALVRAGMTMGFHIDPQEMEGISPYQAILRRRLWTSILELDTQAALASGLPPALRGEQIDVGSLIGLNVNDSVLKSDMESMPSNIPLGQNTDSTHQLLLAGSLKERMEMAYLVTVTRLDNNDVTSALNLCRHLQRELDMIPRTLQIHDDYPESDQLLSRILLTIQLQRPLLIFHRALLVSDITDGALITESRNVCVQQSLCILTQLDSLDPELADPNIIQSRRCWDLFLRECSGDVAEAISALCLAIQAERTGITTTAPSPYPGHSTQQFPPTPISMASTPYAATTSPPFAPHNNETNHVSSVSTKTKTHTSAPASPMWTFANLSRAVDCALYSLLSRMDDLGNHMKPLFGLCVVYEYVRARSADPEARDAAMTAGIYRFFKDCQRRFVVGDLPGGRGTRSSDLRGGGGGGGGGGGDPGAATTRAAGGHGSWEL